MAIRLIVTDLDGTLLSDKKEVSPRAAAAMRRARALGVKTTAATGRMHIAAAYFARRFGADAPVISCNGGLIKALSGETVFSRSFPPEFAKEVIAECYKNDWYAQWYVGEQVYAKEFRPAMFTAYRMIDGFKINEIGDDFARFAEGVVQIVVRDNRGEIAGIGERLKERFGDSVSLQQNTVVSVDITPPGVHKAAGLAILAESLGVKREEIMALGDADNDLTMLQFAGLSVATANALPRVKEIADFVTDDCNQDGAAKAIERYVLGE